MHSTPSATHLKDEVAFYLEIAQHPNDCGVRLVFADWLDERGRKSETAAWRWMGLSEKQPCGETIGEDLFYLWYDANEADAPLNSLLPITNFENQTPQVTAANALFGAIDALVTAYENGTWVPQDCTALA